MQKFFFQEKNDNEVNIHIYGEIGWDESYFGSGTNNEAYALVSLIKRLDTKYKRINVHINSPGGYIEDGLAIYNTLKNAKADIHTYNNGLVASMASIIMLAGTTHFPKTSIYHLHSASTVTIGNIQEHQQAIDNLAVFENALISAITEKTGKEHAEISELWFDGKDHYMTAEEAKEFGFVDFLEDESIEPPANKKQLQNMSYNQVLQLYNQAAKNKQEKSFMQQIKKAFNISTQKNENKMSKLVFKAKLTVLLSLIGLEEFLLNDNQKVELDINDVFKINDTIEENQKEIEALKQELQAKDSSIEQKDKEINNLNEKLSGKPADNPQNPKIKDNSGTEPIKVVILDDELSQKIHAFNKAEGLYS